MDKLDDALLFIVSFVGLLATIVQGSFFGISVESLFEILPLLVLGMGIPLYIGYFRAAISIAPVNRSIMERMRGWVYLIMGVSGYLGFVFSPRYANQIDRWIVLYSIVAIGLVLAFFVQRWFIDVFGVGENLSYQYSFFGTIVPAFLLSFVWRMLVSIYFDLSAKPGLPLPSMLLLTGFIWITWCATMVYFAWEKMSRSIVTAALQLNKARMQRRRHWNFTVKLFLLNIDIYRFLLMGNIKPEAKVGWSMGIVLGGLGFLLFAIPVLGLGFLLVSMFFFGLGTFRFCRRNRIDFSEFHHACIDI